MKIFNLKLSLLTVMSFISGAFSCTIAKISEQIIVIAKTKLVLMQAAEEATVSSYEMASNSLGILKGACWFIAIVIFMLAIQSFLKDNNFFKKVSDSGNRIKNVEGENEK